ncbi:MAG: hypothetical protein JWQ38_3495 [Flavipsychrobacter sp.]|nr:hypothetical protein [Flavipsychrobacter sp.]
MANTDIITPDTVVVRNDKKFITSPIGDEIVMMSIESGNYIGINEVASTIWKKLETPLTVKDLVTYLLASYDIGEKECEEKTIAHLDDMLKKNMISIVP